MAASPVSLPEPSPLVSERRARWIEWICIYLLAFGSSLIISLFYTFSGFQHIAGNAKAAGPERFVSAVILQACAIAVLLCLYRRRGDSFATLGFAKPTWRDARDMVLLFAVSYLLSIAASYAIVYFSWYVLGIHDNGALRTQNTDWLHSHTGTTALVLASLARWLTLITNPFCEELIARVYTQTEWERNAGFKPWQAAALSALIQAMYHLYQGIISATVVFVLFFVYAAYFARWRRFLPVFGAHLIADTIALARH